MRISIVAVGSKMPQWVINACAEYYDRIPQLGIKTIEIALNKRNKNADIERLIENDKAESYKTSAFTADFKKDLEKDLKTLKHIKALWAQVKKKVLD